MFYFSNDYSSNCICPQPESNKWIKKSFNETGLKPFDFNKQAMDLLIRTFRQSTHLLEYGSGGSTYLATQEESLKKIWTIDSDPSWLKKLEDIPSIKYSLEKDRSKLIHIDIGKTKSFGHPINNEKKEFWPNYSKAIDLIPTEYQKKIDLVFIDGRFRIACAYYAFLKTNQNCLFLVHDIRRYESDLKNSFFTLIEKRTNLGLFKKKDNINIENVKKFYEEKKYVKNRR